MNAFDPLDQGTDMRRRQFIGATAAAAMLGLPGARGARAGYGPLGVVEIQGATEGVVGDDGGVAYVATGHGFATVDVRDPANPTILTEREELLADREDGPLEGIIDVKVDGDRLVVPGPGNPTDDDSVSGFLLYDVSDPASPEQLAFHETSAAIHNVYLEGNRVYLTQGASVDIVDVTADEPVAAGDIEITDFDPKWSDVNFFLRRPHDVWVQDRMAYIPMWEAGTLVVDATDPSAPELVTHVEGRPFGEVASVPFDATDKESTEPPGNHHYAQASADGRLLAVGKESWDAEPGDDAGGPSGIELWDISKPSAPLKLSEIHPPRAADETRRGTWTTSHNFDLVGDRLYSSWYQGGLKIHDISDPGRPEELLWWREPERAAFWSVVRATEDTLVASAARGSIGPTLTEGVFTFPTQPAEQADPPGTPAAGAPVSSFATARPTPTPTPTPTPSPSPSPTATPTPTESPGQPGFGVLGGLVGVVSGLWWLSRGRGQ